jgi:hypothetical protein
VNGEFSMVNREPAMMSATQGTMIVAQAMTKLKKD